MIATVVFDLGGVLIDWNPRHLYRKIFGADEAGMEAFLSQVCNDEWNQWQDAGRSWAEAIEETVARHPTHESSIRAYHERWPEMLAGPIHGTVAILEQLRAKGIRLLALTNWSTETFPIAQARYPFLQYFEGILVSGHERLAKPDPAIFHLLIQRYEVDLASTVFIDDNPGNVAASNRVGLKALHFTTPAQLHRELGALGLPLSLEE